MKVWRDANKEHRAAYMKQWKADNAVSQAAYQKDYMSVYQAMPETQMATWVRNLMRNYRMTPHQFNELWEAQGGKCGVCEVDMKPRGREKESACVDHNHTTGVVRGLLCRECNNGIGCLKDCPEVLELAAKYLRAKGHYSKRISQKKVA